MLTEASNGTAAAPADVLPAAETAENVEGKSTVEDPPMEADKVSILFFYKIYDMNHVFGYNWSDVIGNAVQLLWYTL